MKNVITKGMDRRKFIAALSAGTAHLLFSGSILANQSPSETLDPLQKVTLGKSGLTTSLLGVGTGIGGYNRTSFLTKQDHHKSIEMLVYAYDRGFRLFDCADTYGTHQIMAESLKQMKREEVTLVSKIWVKEGGIPEFERPDADVVVERFRKELNTDYIDLVQIHYMVDDDWDDSLKRQMEILDNLKSKGIIRAHGVSVHSLEAMKVAVTSPWVDVIHVRINPYGIAMDKPDPADVVGVIKQLHEAEKGVIGMKLIGNGKFSDDDEKIDNSLRFVLGLGTVDTMIIGFEQKEQIDDYLARTEIVLKELRT